MTQVKEIMGDNSSWLVKLNIYDKKILNAFFWLSHIYLKVPYNVLPTKTAFSQSMESLLSNKESYFVALQ